MIYLIKFMLLIALVFLSMTLYQAMVDWNERKDNIVSVLFYGVLVLLMIIVLVIT